MEQEALRLPILYSNVDDSHIFLQLPGEDSDLNGLQVSVDN